MAMNTKPRLCQRLAFNLIVAVVIGVCFGARQGVAQQSVVGEWSTVNPLPFFPVHAHTLPTGKVMIWPGDEGISGNDPRSWDPANQSVSPLSPPGFDLFCTGHSFLADGRLFVAGGHIQNGVGLPNASIYNPSVNAWTALPAMNAGRWYPTTTVLANGDVLVVSGSIDGTFGTNTVPQVFQVGSGTWRNLAELGMDLYPQMFLAPNGKVFNPGPAGTTRYLDTAGSGTWSFVANRVIFPGKTDPIHRDYGSGVMYAPGKVLVMGGGEDPPTNTAEVIDLNQPSPTWRAVGSMAFARRQLNATLLPDGTVLVTGGTSSPGFNDPAGAVHAAELWNPTTEQWTTLASSSGIPRVYHSTALLLPDGRVLSMGGNGFEETEIYSPPYLFKGTRPTITSAPASVAYGQSFFVGTPGAAAISKVTMLRLSSVTHAFNMSQHISTLSFSQAPGGLNVVAPSGGTAAPPGPYLLFILNGSGVPSVASIVQVGSGPTLTSLSPTSAAAGGAAFTLTVNGGNFVSGSVVRWNGANRTTTFGSPTQLTAAITAADIAAAGSASVTVQNPGGAVSNALTFTITGASTPTLTSLSPGSAAAGGPAFTLTVNGSNFVSGSVVRWNGANRTTTFVSATQLTAAITAADIAPAGTASVTVQNPGGAVSNALTFTITGASTPTLTALSPSRDVAGGAAFTLTVNGSNFVSGSVVRWNGANRTTTFVSATQLSAAITAADIGAAGSASVTVQNPDGAVSNALTFTITSSPEAITREVWIGISGTTVANIPVGAAPNLTDTRPSFEAPSNWADNYGTRMRGYITAPATGSYTFWIASDDNSELWLSSNDNPANKVRIGWVLEWTDSREWDKFPSQKSAAITLTARSALLCGGVAKGGRRYRQPCGGVGQAGRIDLRAERGDSRFGALAIQWDRWSRWSGDQYPWQWDDYH